VDLLTIVNFHLIPGLVLGSIYALAAVGLTLQFGILRFANFAHGDYMSWGAYSALAGVALAGLTPYQAIPLAIASTILMALAVDRLFFGRMRKASPIVLLISAFGVALMVRALIYAVWGPTPANYSGGIVRPLIWEGLRIQWRHLYILAGAASLALALHLFLSRTRTGKAMRAMSDNADLARISGISTEAVIRTTWVVSAGLAAIAGVFVGIDTQLNPLMGLNLLLPTFAATILGGIGKPYGAIAGGLIVGLAEEMSTIPVWGGASLLDPSYKAGVSFAILVAVLVFRPTGIFRSPT
jgi:branched-subunit amino acid ABC-type transport system permease component